MAEKGKGAGRKGEGEKKKKGTEDCSVSLLIFQIGNILTSTVSSDSTSTKDSIALTMLSRIPTRESELIPHLQYRSKEKEEKGFCCWRHGRV